MFFEQIQLNALGQYLSVFLPHARLYWLYLASSIILAFFAYHQFNHDHHDENEAGTEPAEKPSFLKFLFDKDTYLHRSTWQDVKYFFVNAVLYTGVVAQFLIGMHGLALAFHSGLTNLLGPLDTPAITSEFSLIGYTLLSVIAVDIGIYLSHRAQHHIPILWEFHKVHHSAEKMTTMAQFRMHPVDLFITCLLYTSPSPRDRG